MKRIFILIILFGLKSYIYGQISKSEYSYLETKIPKEIVKLQTNTNLLLAGEYFYYKVACFIEKKQSFSPISKMAYVELVGTDETSIFKHKLKLKNSTSHGEFFIPSTIKTGHYKLISYTNWSKNNQTDSFTELDIYIINPYSTEAQITSHISDNQKPATEIIKKSKLQAINQIDSNQNTLKLNKTSFGKRQKVTLQISTDAIENSNSYSLSVRQIDSVETLVPNNQSKIQETRVNTYYLPELRGEIISGKLETLNNVNNSNITMTLSFPGKNNILKSTTTNSKGQFYFIIDEDYNNATINLQVNGEEKENFKIILDNKKFNHYNQLNFTDLSLNPDIKNWLEKESIHHQIENAYFSVKADSVIHVSTNKSFYQPIETTFKLDDYTRFKTVKETFIEIIKTASISKQGSIYKFKLPDLVNIDFNRDLNYLNPLILVDGLRIQNNEIIMNYNSHNIECIQTVTGQYAYQSELYNGIIAFKTFDKDFILKNKADYIKNIEFKNILPNKIYYQPNYNGSQDLSRIPDYRKQLLWIPNLNIDKQSTINFYTSDSSGLYEVVLKAILPTGETIKTTTSFKVTE